MLLNKGMQDDLMSSLQHVADIGPASLCPILDNVIGKLHAGCSFGPDVFGLYYQLVEQLLEKEFDEVLAIAQILSTCPTRSDQQPWRILGRGSVESQSLDTVLDCRLGGEAADFCSVPAEEVVDFKILLQEAMDLLAEGLPGLHDELVTIVSDVLLAKSPPGALYEFDGASHYQFWGLLLLNPKHHRTRLAVAEVLAHESGHSVLFGLTREQVLANNPDDDLYSSPLRADPRPMDGIIHATYVSARMAWTMETLAASDCLSTLEREVALQAAIDDRERFHAGLSTVLEHAQLTSLGRDVIDGARAWIGPPLLL